jgi:hypothetical protein
MYSARGIGAKPNQTKLNRPGRRLLLPSCGCAQGEFIEVCPSQQEQKEVNITKNVHAKRPIRWYIDVLKDRTGDSAKNTAERTFL